MMMETRLVAIDVRMTSVEESVMSDHCRSVELGMNMNEVQKKNDEMMNVIENNMGVFAVRLAEFDDKRVAEMSESVIGLEERVKEKVDRWHESVIGAERSVIQLEEKQLELDATLTGLSLIVNELGEKLTVSENRTSVLESEIKNVAEEWPKLEKESQWTKVLGKQAKKEEKRKSGTGAVDESMAVVPAVKFCGQVQDL